MSRKGEGFMLEAVYQNERYNCTHITIAAMLERLGIDVTLLFNQAGLYFEFQKGQSPTIVIEPYFQSFKDNIKQYFGLNVETEEYLDIDSFIHRLEELLVANQTVGVLSDVFSLDYSRLNEKRVHYLHSFEILGKVDSNYKVADHYFSHSEKMNKFRLINILNEFQNQLSGGRLVLFFLTRDTNQFFLPEQNYIEVIKNNWNVMRGERCFLLQDTTEYPGVLGLQAIKKCGDQLLNIIRGNFDNKDFLVSHIYTSLKEVSNSRYNAHSYLNKFGELDLAKLYLTSHQSWIVYANLLMKALMYPNIDMQDRLQKRIQLLFSHEQAILENIERLIVKV